MDDKTASSEPTGGKKPKREKKKFYKLNLRNLPNGITSDELRAKIISEPAPSRFWFRPGEPFLEYDARPYAFVVFDNFEVAAKFQRQWHGKTVTAEANGEESVMLVEKAANQDWARKCLSTPNNVKPITSNIDYIKFAEEAESRCITKQVDFDVLVNEIIEREAKLVAGFCQDTPLTDFFVKRAHDKLMKGRAKIGSKVDKFGSKYEKEFKKEKPPREQAEKPAPKSRPIRPVKEKKEPRERKPQTPKSTGSAESPVASTASISGDIPAEKPIRSPREPRKRPQRPSRGGKADVEKPSPRKDAESSKPSSPAKTIPASTESTNRSNEKDSAPAKQGPGGAKGRNKDRPERALYQPGRGRRYKPGGETRPASNV